MSQEVAAASLTQNNEQSEPVSPYLEPSSDLEDCRLLWHDELGRYIMETRHRERQIESWFEQEVLVRTLFTDFPFQS
jgi:hypothetical protein